MFTILHKRKQILSDKNFLYNNVRKIQIQYAGYLKTRVSQLNWSLKNIIGWCGVGFLFFFLTKRIKLVYLLNIFKDTPRGQKGRVRNVSFSENFAYILNR